VKDGKIARIGKAIENGRQIIDARGLVVTPGFIDSHSHSDRAILTYSDQREKIEQGITTSMPARVYGLKGKGLLWEGFDADICIFDPERIIDRAEYTKCHLRAEGLNYVILGGEVVVEDAVHNGKGNGKVIPR